MTALGRDLPRVRRRESYSDAPQLELLALARRHRA